MWIRTLSEMLMLSLIPASLIGWLWALRRIASRRDD
jgi:hypothetical protein